MDMPANVKTDRPSVADRRWFGERVESLLPELYGTAMRLCDTRADAEDLVAESVAKAWEALPSLEDREKFRAWVFRILNNTFVSNCRSAEAKVVHEPYEPAENESFSLFERLHAPVLLWWGANPEMEFLNRLLREDLERAIDGLAEPFRSVVVMVDIEGLSYREVSEILDVPVGTVRSRLSRGRSRLQETLWNHAHEAGLTDGPPAQSHDQDR